MEMDELRRARPENEPGPLQVVLPNLEPDHGVEPRFVAHDGHTVQLYVLLDNVPKGVYCTALWSLQLEAQVSFPTFRPRRGLHKSCRGI